MRGGGQQGGGPEEEQEGGEERKGGAWRRREDVEKEEAKEKKRRWRWRSNTGRPPFILMSQHHDTPLSPSGRTQLPCPPQARPGGKPPQ